MQPVKCIPPPWKDGEKEGRKMRIFRADAYSCCGDDATARSKWRILICINPAITGDSQAAQNVSPLSSQRFICGTPTHLPEILKNDSTSRQSAIYIALNPGRCNGKKCQETFNYGSRLRGTLYRIVRSVLCIHAEIGIFLSLHAEFKNMDLIKRGL